MTEMSDPVGVGLINISKGETMKTTWWLRIIGVFYLLLVLGSVWEMFINTNIFGSIIPFGASDLHAFSDAWLIFTLELAVLGVIMLYYARDSSQNRILVLTVAILEIIRGAGGDLIWMSRGWPTAIYIPFTIVHLIIAGTGLYFLRQEAR
jgi:hypothetical protein